MRCNQKFAGIQDAFIAMFPPPPVQGLGTIGGFKLQIEDRAGLGYEALDEATKAIRRQGLPDAGARRAVLELSRSTSPQLYADVDRDKAQAAGRAAHGRVRDDADLSGLALRQRLQPLRPHLLRCARRRTRSSAPEPDDIGQLKVRQRRGEMVPLGALVERQDSRGPERVMRYNGFLAADINGAPAPGYLVRPGRGRDRSASRNETLPNGIGFEWTDLTYQQILAGNTAMLVFPLCVLLVFLVLAAQYESLFAAAGRSS